MGGRMGNERGGESLGSLVVMWWISNWHRLGYWSASGASWSRIQGALQ